MTTRRTSTVMTRWTAIATLIALLLTACGSGAEAVAANASLAAADEALPAADAAPAGSASSSGHQYGTSIEEWAEVERAKGAAAPGEALDGSQSDYAEIEWKDLIPAGASSDELMARFEERLEEAEPGSSEALALYEEIQAEWNPEAINPQLDGEQIRLAGFVAPLTYEDEIVTEFLLVPTFGACVHVPPPPPNQTIMVSVDKADGLTVDESWGAVWVEGTLTIETENTDLATASYKIINATSGVHEAF